jgi:hypothetical protein
MGASIEGGVGNRDGRFERINRKRGTTRAPLFGQNANGVYR